jgi:glyoxylase-like metal-dependent hydrolase (beta-lactamase superfamily II)
VDAVVCTHLHVDHVGWNTMLEGDKWVPTFPKARYLIGRKEYEHWMGEGDEEQQVILSDSIAPIFEAGLAELVDMDHRLSPEVRLVPTAGHTPGHVSVAIESKGERALITGDFMHHPSQIARPHWCPPFDHDTAASTQTRKAMIEDLADGPVLVIGTHFAAPTAGHIVRDGDSYRFDA